MSVNEILNEYPNLPQKFLVKFSLECAHNVKDLVKDIRSKRALEVASLWLDDKMCNKDLEKVHADASASTYEARSAWYREQDNDSYITYMSRNSAYSVIDSILCPSNAISSAYIAYITATNAKDYSSFRSYLARRLFGDKNKNRLRKIIKMLTPMEKLMYSK